MSHFSDSMDPTGFGIPILQHLKYDDKGFSLDLRGSIKGVRVLDRIDAGGLGVEAWTQDKNGPQTVGDMIGWQFLEKTSREISAWRAAVGIRIGALGTPTGGGAVAFDPVAVVVGGGGNQFLGPNSPVYNSGFPTFT